MITKLHTRDDLIAICAKLKREGRKIVYTSGSFDLLHAGHVEYLKAARALGDVLIVGLNSDRSVKQYKDPNRPINDEQSRAVVLSALECVDLLFIFDDTNNNKNIELLKPDIYAKAGDYDRSKLSSAPLVESYGGRVEIIKFKSGYSTSSIIDRILARFSANTFPAKDLPLPSPAPAIFLDRDGTIIEHVDYLSDPSKVKIIPGALEGIKKLKDAGFRIVITTNQPGIGIGYSTKEDFYAVNREFLKHLSGQKVAVDKIYYCPHSVGENCTCRKPAIEMALRAERELNVVLKDSFVIGDMTIDLQFAKNVGCRSVLVKTGKGGSDGSYQVPSDYTAEDLNSAANIILKEGK